MAKTTELDYEKISIYPMDYDPKKREELLRQLRKLGITFSYENWS